MLAISVEFLQGTFRGDPDGTAVTGELTRGEWPPSPARLFAALVAADGTRQASRVTNGHELIWLEGLPAPVIYAQPEPSHQVLRPRFVVAQRGAPAKSTHHEYVARGGALHRPGARVALANPLVVYRWTVEPPDEETLDSVRRRAARVGYLGASDSPARVRVSTRMPCGAVGEVFVPDPNGDIRISVPRPGDVAVLDRMYDAWKERGASMTRSQFPALLHWATYRSPGVDDATDRGEVVAWLRLHPAVSGRRISAVTSLFKDAVLSRHQRLHGEPPAILHGHGFTSPGYDLARYLALPDVGYPRSRGRIHGLALWLPPGSDRDQRPEGARRGHCHRGARRPWHRGAGGAARGRGAPLGCESAPLARAIAHMGDSVPRGSREAGRARPFRSRLLVPPRRPSGFDCLSFVAHTAASRRGRFGTGGGQPPGTARVAVLPRRVPLRGADCGTGRCRRRTTAWTWPLRARR